MKPGMKQKWAEFHQWVWGLVISLILWLMIALAYEMVFTR